VEYPEIWEKGSDDENSQNRYEHQLLDKHIKNTGILQNLETRYIKILDVEEGKYTERKLQHYLQFPLVSIVVNFVDILGHRRSESEVLKEIAPHESGYRSLIRSWFEHSSLFQIMQRLAQEDVVILLTTDHGSIRAMRPAKVVGDKETSTSLRYKFGRNLKCDHKQAWLIKNPVDFRLPYRGLNCQYLLAKEDYFLIYPSNFNKYANMYKNCFQHGGISMEEMILPIVRLEGKIK